MPTTRKLVQVFLASPGDLQEERRAAKAVVDDLNSMWADELGHVELVGWEDTVSGSGRPQAIINRDLERCEFFVGMMWMRWGTPPGGAYTSGFEEEYRTSVARLQSEGRPEISLFFKDIAPEFLRDPGDELKKVLAFKKEIAAERTLLFGTFADVREFENRFRRCVTKYLRGLKAKEAAQQSDRNQSPTTGGEAHSSQTTSDENPQSPFSAAGASFLREFLGRTQGDADGTQLAATEIARFRLLGSIVGVQGNDDGYLGAHDANLLFVEDHGFSFGKSELTGLISTGLAHYAEENVPLWKWVAAANGFTRNLLPAFSIVGSTTRERVGALAAMRLVAEPLRKRGESKRENFLTSWLAEGVATPIKVAALSYLGDTGVSSDLALIRKEFDRSDTNTTSAATEAIIRINLRDSRELGIRALLELQPSTISAEILAKIFRRPASVATELLVECTAHKCPRVREIAVRLLRDRSALSAEIAEQSLADSDAKVRYWALRTLVDAGRAYADDQVKKVLIKPTSSLRLFNFASDADGEERYELFRLQQLNAQSIAKLEAAAREADILEYKLTIALADRQFKKRGHTLRAAVADCFEQEFERTLERMVGRFGSEPDLIRKIRELEKPLRKEWTRLALDVICRRKRSGDIALVRKALRGKYIEHYSDSDVAYLRACGEWEDVHLLIDLLAKPMLGRRTTALTLGIDEEPKFFTVAQAIQALGKGRLPDVLALPAPLRLQTHLIAGAPTKTFRNLDDEVIFGLLRSEQETIRKAVALKCVRTLPKGRIARLLREYLQESRYYNVVHWLDLGASVPTDRARDAAERALSREWPQREDTSEWRLA